MKRCLDWNISETESSRLITAYQMIEMWQLFCGMRVRYNSLPQPGPQIAFQAKLTTRLCSVPGALSLILGLLDICTMLLRSLPHR